MQEIAIIGAGLLLPGGIEDPEALWQFMLDGNEASGPIPSGRWSWKRFYSPDPLAPGKTTMLRGNFLQRDNASFDPLFFGISPREAALLDPLQRFGLEATWHALEDSGLRPEHLRGSRTGVFMGAFAQDFFANSASPLTRPLIADHFSATSGTATMIAARLSYVFDLRGPAMTLDTACSASMTALHQACLSLRAGESDMALAGGVNYMLLPETAMSMSKGRFLSADGRSRSFSAGAEGYGRGEGAAVLVLKRLEDALRDGDRVRAVISATGLNQDGRTQALPIPSAQAQETLLREVMVQGGVTPEQISFVEAHGAGTAVGDPIEAQAISEAVGRKRRGGKLPVGSIKASLGHLEATAGVAGVIRAMLCLEQGRVPPQPDLENLSPDIPWDENGLAVPQNVPWELEPAPQSTAPFHALVNSFGYGGTNGVALLRGLAPHERAPQKQRNRVEDSLPECSLGEASPQGFMGYLPLFLSANSAESLKALAARYVAWFESAEEPLPGAEDISLSAVETRTHFRHRAVILTPAGSETTPADWLPGLQAVAAGQSHPDVQTGEVTGAGFTEASETVRPVFVYGGMGAQWAGMGSFLLHHAPANVTAQLRVFEEAFEALAGWSLREKMQDLAESGEELSLQEAALAQPLLFWMEMGLTALLAAYGVKPGAVIGHSTGELAAAWAAGAIDAEAAAKVVYHHGRLQVQLEGRGGMLVVRAEQSKAAALAEGLERVGIAALNGPDSVIFSGSTEGLEKLAGRCRKNAVATVALNVKVPFHSPALDEIKASFVEALVDVGGRTELPFYSTVTGARLEGNALLDGTYWHQNTRQTVRFQAAVEAALADGHRVFLELSPLPVLLGAVQGLAAQQGVDIVSVATQRRRQKNKGVEDFARALAALACGGAEPDWQALLTGRRVRLPLYPWTHGPTPWKTREIAARDRLDQTVHPVLGTPRSGPEQGWNANLTYGFMPWLPDHRLTDGGEEDTGQPLFPASAFVEAGLAAHWLMEGKAPALLENIRLTAPLLVSESQTGVISWAFDPADRRLILESETLEGEGDWQRHGTMQLLQAAPWPAPPASADVPWRKPEGWESVPPAALYEAFACRGFAYGPAFQNVRQLWRQEQRAAGLIALDGAQRAESAEYLLHPALLDGAFQLLGALVPEDLTGLYAPHTIRRFVWHGARSVFKTRAVVTMLAADTRRVMADVALYDETGNCLGEVQGLECRALPNRQPVPAQFYGERWAELPTPGLLAEPRSLAVLGTLPEGGAHALEENGAELQHFTSVASLLDRARALPETVVVSLDANRAGAETASVHQLAILAELLCGLAMLPKPPCVKIVGPGLFWPDSQTVAGLPPARALALAPVVGFVRSARLELPDLKIQMIGFSEEEAKSEEACAALALRLAAEIVEPVFGPSGSGEDEVYLTGSGENNGGERGGRFGMRLETLPSQPLLRPVPWQPDDPAQAIELIRNQNGQTGISGLGWQKEVVPPPGQGQIAVKALAASLNFKDLLKVMDLLPDSVTDNTHHGAALGTEAVVEVTAIGEGVENIQPGMRFLSCQPGAFVSRRLVDVGAEAALIPLPALPGTDGLAEGAGQGTANPLWDPAALAGLPVAALTAWHSLVTLARLEEGESVLIHAAAGGVGQMAVQIARLRGAKIYATAGSEEKRCLLRKQGCAGVWNTRTLEFAEGVRAATKGAGVDVVLNCLPGEAMAASLEVTAPFGRFVEIGKRDIIEEGRLNLTPFNENLTFFSFDLDRLMKSRPAIVRRELEELLELMREGALTPPPVTVFPAAEVGEAFRFLASSRHVGKVVVRFEGLEEVRPLGLPPAFAPIGSEGAYLVTGGTRGFGLETARWLVAQGARHVHVLGRKPVDLSAFQASCAEVGAQLRVHQGDVADCAAMKTLVQDITRDRPLKGVFHAAAVLEDATLAQLVEKGLQEQAFQKVLAPKMAGALALHEATLNQPLEHFVLYSSLVAKLGNSGQTAYGAANSFLEELAAYRRAQGLPALAVGWGAIAEGGMMTDTLQRVFAHAGIITQPAQQVLSALPVLGSLGVAWAAMADVDWEVWFAAMGSQTGVARLGQLPRKGSAEGLSALLALPESAREAYVLQCLRDELGRVLQSSPEGIDPATRLASLGVDSLAGLELQLALRRRLGVELPLPLLARCETVGALATALTRHATQALRHSSAASSESEEERA